MQNRAKKKMSKAGAIATAVILLLSLAGVSVMVYFGDKDPDVYADGGAVVIEGMYGLRAGFAEITGITLLEENMRAIGPGSRTNGYGGIGDALKGDFKSDTLGELLLFVRANSAPTIHIARNGAKDIYISLRSGEETRALFAELEAAFSAR